MHIDLCGMPAFQAHERRCGSQFARTRWDRRVLAVSASVEAAGRFFFRRIRRHEKRCRLAAASLGSQRKELTYWRARRRRTIKPRPNKPAAISASVPGSGTVVADMIKMLFELSVVPDWQLLELAHGTSTM